VSIRNLDKIFKPGGIAVVGASDEPTSVGGTVFRNLRQSAFAGPVYPVNPKRASVQGVEALAAVDALPEPVDLAVVCTPAASVPAIVRQCGESGILGLVITSAGFREMGPEGKALEDRINEEARRFDGLRIIGPNCLGVIAPGVPLNASFAGASPPHGHVAFISQSGALCTSVLDWAIEEGIGFSYFVSLGNALDVDFGDLIDYFSRDGATRSAVLYIESISDARKFMSAARAFSRGKPLVAYKAGRFAESAQAAASHTGALAGEDAVYDAAFERAGIVRVFGVEEMFECAELLARQRVPRGARLAIVTNAGGPGVMATDSLIASRGSLARLSEETLRALNEALPPFWSRGNPVDVLGDAPPERFARAAGLVLKDTAVDAALVILTPQAMTDPTATARAVAEVATQSDKPLLASWMGGGAVRAGTHLLQSAGIPAYPTPDPAVRAFMYLVSYARNLEILHETPRDIPVAFTPEREGGRERLGQILSSGRTLLSEIESKELLAGYGIPVNPTRAASSAEEAVRLAREFGYPVVLKLLSPQITHKTDVGGVALNLASDEAVRQAFARIVAGAREKRPDAQVDGVTVQKMVALGDRFELILGTKKDPTFGAAILLGMGGITAELYRDRALGLPPLNERLARRMIESLRSWPLLKGYRGRPGVDLDRLIEIVMRFSYLVADLPEILELDINPLLAGAADAVAVDARLVIDRQATERPPRPYAHLAIRPYPEPYVRPTSLRDGTAVTLRPIKPEDEPLWHELIAACSRDSIYYRFRYLFRKTTHDMATRYCFIDYDREIAIVAEIVAEGARKLIGVGRLVSDPDREFAEYAVLVADAWQGKGIGGLLTDYCLEIAGDWGLKRVVAETMPDNRRMIATFRRRSFELEHDLSGGVVLARRDLQGA
jgi:acetyltransferase